jgi:hypothetical protein
MSYEAPHHKALFEPICPGPTPYIITTQGHVDHVGGVSLFREPGTRYVAQANNPACQADDARIARFRAGTAMLWFGQLAGMIAASPSAIRVRRTPGSTRARSPVRVAPRTARGRSRARAARGARRRDRRQPRRVAAAAPDRAALEPVRAALPHFPNFNTLRGDKYRFAEPYLANLRRVRDLAPEL